VGWVQVSKEEASSLSFDLNVGEVRESIKSFRPQLEEAGIIPKSGQPSNDKAPIAASASTSAASTSVATTSAGDSVEDSYQEGKLE